jgi:hypothetical protein
MEREPRTWVRMQTCRRCRRQVPPGVLIKGDCPDCCGLVPLDLGGDAA